MIANKFYSLLTMLGLAFALTGCVDLSTPTRTLGSAVKAAEKNNLKDFQSTLVKSLVDEVGTHETMETWRTAFSAYDELLAGKLKLIDIEMGDQGYGHFGDILRVFDLPLIGSKDGAQSLILTAGIKCWVWVERISSLPNQGPCQGNPNYPNCPGPGDDVARYQEMQTCRIYQITNAK